jgi:Uma2 family endonuclease
MAHAKHHTYLYSDYLTLEQHSLVRHEFLDGEIYAMAGGTPEHAALAATALRLIGNQLPNGCRTYTSDLRIRIESSDLTTYPDGAVICGKVVPASDDAMAATNPIMVIEVTSPSSEAYDRGAKLQYYQSLLALRVVLILSHRETRLDLFERNDDNLWRSRFAQSGENLHIASLGITLLVDDLYKDVS